MRPLPNWAVCVALSGGSTPRRMYDSGRSPAVAVDCRRASFLGQTARVGPEHPDPTPLVSLRAAGKLVCPAVRIRSRVAADPRCGARYQRAERGLRGPRNAFPYLRLTSSHGGDGHSVAFPFSQALTNGDAGCGYPGPHPARPGITMTPPILNGRRNPCWSPAGQGRPLREALEVPFRPSVCRYSSWPQRLGGSCGWWTGPRPPSSVRIGPPERIPPPRVSPDRGAGGPRRRLARLQVPPRVSPDRGAGEP